MAHARLDYLVATSENLEIAMLFVTKCKRSRERARVLRFAPRNRKSANPWKENWLTVSSAGHRERESFATPVLVSRRLVWGRGPKHRALARLRVEAELPPTTEALR